ncbi:MAG: tetratricopeptide repeat protein [Elusimicrobia bacterium]|nr:tetratricopeptide repeat protein [Elusimicrobiota bacterium]
MRLTLAAWTALAPATPALALVEAPDLSLMRQEGEIKGDLEVKIQRDILDPILGKDRAKVFIDIELEVMAKRQENVRAGQGVAERNREKAGAGGEKTTDFIVPGVPRPKTITSLSNPGRPEAAQAQLASQERKEQEEVFSLKPIVKSMLVTVIHDDTLAATKLELVRQRIIDALAKFKVAKDMIVFRPTRFNALSWLDDLKDPRVWIPLVFAGLFLLLLLYLFGPLTRLMRAYIEAIKEKPAAEVNVESEIEAPEAQGDDLGADKRELDIMLGRKPPEPPPPAEDEDAMKKFEPFVYITEDNLKRLANLFLLRREEPWLIAVVLSYLKPEFARQVLTQLPVELQARVALEALKVRQVTREQVAAIDADIKESVDFVVGGMERLTQMLEESDSQTRSNILEYLKNEKPAVYERVRKFILTFEDIATFPEREMQLIVRELKTEAMARALQNATPDDVNKFLTNMSTGASSLLKESMEYAKGLTPAQIEEERSKIIDTIKALEKEGKIAVRDPKGSGEAFQEELATERSERIVGGSAKAPAPAAVAALAAPKPAADPQALLSAGIEAHDGGRFDEAVANLRQAIDADPNLAQAYQYMGSALYQTGRGSEALIYFDKLVQLNPDPEVRAWVESFRAQAGV